MATIINAAYCTGEALAQKRRYDAEKTCRWRARHPEYKERAYLTLRAWRKNNKKRLYELSLRWFRKNPHKWKEYRDRYRKKYHDRYLESNRKWARQNKEKVKAKNALYRARRISNGPHEKIYRGDIYNRDHGVCGLCHRIVSKSNYSLGHIIPVSKGGRHISTNIQLAHRWCNSKKNNIGVSQLRLL